MFSMAVAACANARSSRRPHWRRAAVPRGGRGYAAAPAAQASVPAPPSPAATAAAGPEHGSELGRKARERLLVLLRRVQLFPGYDCSGLVMEAFGHGAGIWLPHSTYTMLGSRHLPGSRCHRPGAGDLMFYGSGHVEINTVWYHQTFGAHHSGERVGWRKGARGGIPRPHTGSGDQERQHSHGCADSVFPIVMTLASPSAVQAARRPSS